jgi:hypothetical protein
MLVLVRPLIGEGRVEESNLKTRLLKFFNIQLLKIYFKLLQKYFKSVFFKYSSGKKIFDLLVLQNIETI